MPSLISVHVPKAAGTSFRQVLSGVYGANWIRFDYGDGILGADSLINKNYQKWYDGNRKRALKKLRMSGAKVVHGHFLLSKYEDLFPVTKRIIWIRDPVRRVVSHYFHARNDRSIPHNTNLKAFSENVFMRNVVSRMITGSRLEDFFFVGIVEDYGDEVVRLTKKMGWDKKLVAPHIFTRANANHGVAYSSFNLDRAEISRIADLNREDIALYEQAQMLRHQESVQGSVGEWVGL